MNQVSYNRGDGVIEIVIKDDTGAKVDQFRMNIKDSLRQKRIAAIIKEKYGIDLTPEFKQKEEGFFDF